MKSPRFAEWAVMIEYDPYEESLCNTVKDIKVDYYDDPELDPVSTVLRETKTELTKMDELPDTQMVKESTLPFSRESLWAVSRAVARGRAVYHRFIHLIGELSILDKCSSAQYKDVIGTPGLREAMVNAVMPLMRPEFFFFLEEHSKTLMICNVDTMKRLWMTDNDVRLDQCRSFVT